MKRFKDLTELEIRDLNEFDLATFISIECAEAGIAIIDKPKKPEYAKEVEPDKMVYQIDGGYGIYIKFENEGEAKKVSDILNTCSIEDKEGIYYVKPRPSYTENVRIRKDQVESFNKNIKRKYDDDYKEYKEYSLKREEVETPILEKFNFVTSKYARLDAITIKYNETYLPLAGGDEEIAKRFLKEAYVISDEDMEYILS